MPRSSRPTTSRPAPRVSVRPVGAEGRGAGRRWDGEAVGENPCVHAPQPGRGMSRAVRVGAGSQHAGGETAPVVEYATPADVHGQTSLQEVGPEQGWGVETPVRDSVWDGRGLREGLGLARQFLSPVSPSCSLPAAPAAAGGTVLWWLQGACGPGLHTTQRSRRGRGE